MTIVLFIQVRSHIRKLQENNIVTGVTSSSPRLLPEWCFLDSVTAERFFRLDKRDFTLDKQIPLFIV